MRAVLFLLIVVFALPAYAVELEGQFRQGGLIFGKATPGTKVSLDGRVLQVSPSGDFVFGFGRDAPPKAVLRIEWAGQVAEERKLDVSPRKYRIQRIDGLPKRMVTPPPPTD